MSKEGFRYSIAFTDDHSDVVFVCFLKDKSDTVEATKKFLADSASFRIGKRLRSDNGGEFVSGMFKAFLNDNKIKHGKSMWPYAAYIRSRCYNNHLKQALYFAFAGRKPNLSKMKLHPRFISTKIMVDETACEIRNV